MADHPSLIQEIVRQVFVQKGLPPPRRMDITGARVMAEEVILARRRELCLDFRYRILEWEDANQKLRDDPLLQVNNFTLYQYFKDKTYTWRNGIREIMNELKELDTSDHFFQEHVYGAWEPKPELPHFSLEEDSEANSDEDAEIANMPIPPTQQKYMFPLCIPSEPYQPGGEGPSSPKKRKAPDTNLVHGSDEEGSGWWFRIEI